MIVKPGSSVSDFLLGIICGRQWGLFEVKDHLRYCTVVLPKKLIRPKGSLTLFRLI